jgi:hypothetical protein
MAGWWRRNGWALPVCVVVLAGAGVPDAKEWYDKYQQGNPTVPVRAGGDGWVRYDTGGVRMVRLEPTTALDRDGAPVALPPDTTAWRATLEFDLPDEKTFEGCQIQATSVTGRLYSGDPGGALGRAEGATLGCRPYDDEKGPRRYTATPMFVVPKDERLVAVRVIQPTRLPRYAELVPAGG